MPTVISLIPDEESRNKIQEYLEANESLVGLIKTRFHSTLLYTETVPVFPRRHIREELERSLPLGIDSTTFQLKLLGENELVIAYEDRKVQGMQELLVVEGMRQVMIEYPFRLSEQEKLILKSYPNHRKSKIYEVFNPHITTARNIAPSVLEKLPPFQHTMTFDQISWRN